MSKPKVLVTRAWPKRVEQELQQRYDVTLNTTDVPMTVAQLQDALRNYDAVCPTVSDKISAEVLSATPMRAKILGNFGVGFNHIDLEAAKKAGLTVSNTPEVLTDCTADTAMTLMLMIARRAGEGERHVRTKAWTGWRPTHMMGTKVTGKVLGLIGFGRIAQSMARKAHFGFGMKIIFSDPYPPPAEVQNSMGAVQFATPQDVVKQADFVALHCPGGKETYHLFNAELIGMMKPGAYLINTARGDVVDQDALIAALKARTIAGAGLDVYEGEPAVREEFLTMDNVVLLPHLGSATTETREAMGMRVLQNLELFFANKPLRDKVV
ncbi:MAG: D-glycerate dehydrogenase [Gammaproteobacteria bacterium]